MLIDFLRAFGGERIVQAAWRSRQASALPPCPALDGTEAEPAVSLKALQAEANGKSSRMDSQRGQVCQAHGTCNSIGRDGDLDAQTDSPPASSSSSALHDAASSLAEEASVTGVISDSGAAGTAPGDDLVPTGSHADVSPQTGDASVPTEYAGAADMHLEDMVSEVAPADAQADSAASSALDASIMEDMPQEWWRPLGSDAESIPEQQLQCIVQGTRLLVILLRDNHTWEPVCPSIQRICLPDVQTRRTHGRLPHLISSTCENAVVLLWRPSFIFITHFLRANT